MNYKKELDKVAEALTQIITEARKEYPNALLSEAGGTLILMSRNKIPGTPRSDKRRAIVTSSKFIAHLDCGGW
jgi:hypothetical protein